MDKEDAVADVRDFQPVTVGKCYSQTADERFGSGASEAVRERERSASYLFSVQDQSPFDWPASGGDSENDGAEASIYRLVPTMQRYRNNLTALSQFYNLYLVAYQGQIFAYVPRSVPRQSLPRHPDARLVPRPSDVSLHIGGHQDPNNPHTINHLMVGSFGTDEIMVACYDDGDVVAYWTREILDWITAKSSRSAERALPEQTKADIGHIHPAPRPLLHENVGDSAWGMAIHKQSRLIAVSSNRHEVTVFALGLTQISRRRSEAAFSDFTEDGCAHVESLVRRRTRNWRIVVYLGPLADNIPNLCFIDDENGSADMICAVDIKGAIWLADIWKPSQAAIRIDPCNCGHMRNSESWPELSRGWGVLALPADGFLRVETVEELLGTASKSLDMITSWTLSSESCLRDIPDNPCLPETRTSPLRLPPHLHQFNPLLGWIPGSSDESDDEVTVYEETDTQELEGSEDEDEDDTSYGNVDEGDGEDDSEDDDDDEQDGSSQENASEDAGYGGNANNVAVAVPIPFYNLIYGELDAEPAYDINEVTAHTNNHGANHSIVPWSDQSQVAVGSENLNGSSQSTRESLGAHEWHTGWDSTSSLDLDRLDMAYFPHAGLARPVPQETTELASFLRMNINPRSTQSRDSSVLEKLSKRYYVLRLHEKELELRNLDQETKGSARECGILCPQAMELGPLAMSPSTNLLFRHTSRLSMVAYLPEISLVAVASPIGRVLLVTPTKLATPVKKGQGKLHHGFRVDWVLPKRSDEELHRRTVRPLHGMAVAPVQESGPRGERHRTGVEGLAPRRYRLMLHYRSHDILTYEITRETETGKLCIL
ncbi:hypothetical protein HIM_02350 [Hirsutella minnesotensis 3608]|nr:hypothetical protein HIM_02350 [Hirsutella minnesotensis 3608]